MTNKIEEKIDLILKDKKWRRDTVEVPTNLLRKVKTKFHKDNHEKACEFVHKLVAKEMIDQYQLLIYLMLSFLNNNKDKKLAKRFFKMFGSMKECVNEFKLKDSYHVQNFIKNMNVEEELIFLNMIFNDKKEKKFNKDLKLVLTYHWFDEIEAGRKDTEYREVKEAWKKLEINEYDTVTFYRGYEKNRKSMQFKIYSIQKMNGKDTDLHIDKEVYAIKLGERLW